MPETTTEATTEAKPAEAALKRCTRKLDDGAQCQNARADQSEKASNRHCKPCRAAAQRKFILSTIDQERGKGYVQGVKAMRDLLVEEFTAQGSGTFTGTEIAQLITQAPGPRREPQAELQRSIPTPDGDVPTDAVTS